MSKKNHIYLGHATEDKAQIRDLYRRLKAEGFVPWLDSEDLIPGQNWPVEIPKAIRSAAIFLACLSKRSVAKKGYVQREFRHALSTFAELPPDTIYLIPVRLDDCEIPNIRLPELELNLRDLQWVDLFDEYGFKKLVGAIERKVKPSSLQRSASGGTNRLSEVVSSFEALFAASEKAATGNNPAARRIRDNLADCLDDLRCRGYDFEVLVTLPSYLASLAQDIDDHLLGQYFEEAPAAKVLEELEALTSIIGDVGKDRVDTLEHEDLIAALKVAIGQALAELLGAGLGRSIAETADRELRHLRREVGKPSFEVAAVNKCRRRLEELKIDLLERTTLLTEALLAEGFPHLPTGTVFRHMPEMWCPQLVMIPVRELNAGLTISKSIALGRYALTFDEYDHFCETTGRHKPEDMDWGRGRRPTVNVSHNDASAYCAWLSEATGACIQLPTEAQWNYAEGHYQEANIGGSLGKTVEVGTYEANDWGLYEMVGNVQEWCNDWFIPKRGHLHRPARDRVVRGGCWRESAPKNYSDNPDRWSQVVQNLHDEDPYRNGYGPGFTDCHIGFRIACVQHA